MIRSAGSSSKPQLIVLFYCQLLTKSDWTEYEDVESLICHVCICAWNKTNGKKIINSEAEFYNRKTLHLISFMLTKNYSKHLKQTLKTNQLVKVIVWMLDFEKKKTYFKGNLIRFPLNLKSYTKKKSVASIYRLIYNL